MSVDDTYLMLWNPAKPNDKNRKTKVKIEKLIFKLRCCRHRKKVREEGLVQRSEVEVIGKKAREEMEEEGKHKRGKKTEEEGRRRKAGEERKDAKSRKRREGKIKKEGGLLYESFRRKPG